LSDLVKFLMASRYEVDDKGIIKIVSDRGDTIQSISSPPSISPSRSTTASRRVMDDNGGYGKYIFLFSILALTIFMALEFKSYHDYKNMYCCDIFIEEISFSDFLNFVAMRIKVQIGVIIDWVFS